MLKNNINYGTFLTASLIYGLGLVGLFVVEWSQLSRGFLYLFTGYTIFGLVGATLGLHRYFCHKSFETSFFFKCLLFLGGSSVFIGSFAEWIHDHINHHRFLNTPKDHTNRNRGFYHSHFAWTYQKRPVVYKYLLKDPFINHIHCYHVAYSLVTAIIVPLLLGLCFTSITNSFFLMVCLRLTVQQNVIFSLGSMCHRETKEGQSISIDNIWLAFLSMGDSYQESHHAHPRDYRHGRKWYSIDPNKWLLLTLEHFGIVRELQVYEHKESHSIPNQRTEVG